jgi:hypothetical protein
VLFGSNADASTCDPRAVGATWTWDGATWTQQNPPAAPDECSGLGGLTMAYDAARREVVLLGGDSFSKTWLWDGTNWTDAHTGITPNAGSPMTYDVRSRRVIAFGGYLFWHVTMTSATRGHGTARRGSRSRMGAPP